MATERWLQVIVHQKAVNDVRPKTNCMKTGVLHIGRGDAATSSPGHFLLALEVGREKALASASHMTTKHTEFVGVFN